MPENGIIGRKCFDREDIRDEFSTIIQSAILDQFVASPWTIAINLIDILIVAYILYHFTKAIAGTKIMILVRGVLVFILAQILANMIGLTTISWLINQIITYGVIAAVVIFSPEIRTGLERLGRATDFFPMPLLVLRNR